MVFDSLRSQVTSMVYYYRSPSSSGSTPGQDDNNPSYGLPVPPPEQAKRTKEAVQETTTLSLGRTLRARAPAQFNSLLIANSQTLILPAEDAGQTQCPSAFRHAASSIDLKLARRLFHASSVESQVSRPTPYQYLSASHIILLPITQFSLSSERQALQQRERTQN
jgi:hypothetical protein